MKYQCLSIAGFDGSGGAGIQADLKTFSALGCYGMNVLTAVAVQNTQGVKSCYDLPLQCIEEQLDAIFEDIPPNAIKIGMLYSKDIIECVARALEKYARNTPIVLDPVMLAKSGDALLLPSAIEALKSTLIPLCTLITPNLPEAAALVGDNPTTDALLTLGAQAVLLKGGHATNITADDIYQDQHGNTHTFKLPRIQTRNTHGTGCTLSSAITSFLARGYPLPEACKAAKQYLYQAMLASKDCSVGKGQGPVHHFHALWTHETHCHSTKTTL